MAKITYNVEDAEPFGEGGGQPKAGVYDAEIVRATHRTEKKDGSPANDIEVVLQCEGEDDENNAYGWVFTYIGLNDSSAGRLREFTNAVGLKAKGGFTTDAENNIPVLAGKKLKVKINPDQYDGEYRARVGRLMKLSESTNGDDAPDADADAEPEDDTDTKASSNGASGFEPSREGDEFGSYDEWEDKDLEDEVEDRGLTVGGGRGKKRDKLIKALRDDDAEAEGGDDADASGDEGDGDNYDEWEPKLLMEEIKDRDLTEHLPKGRRGKSTLIEILRKDDKDEPF